MEWTLGNLPDGANLFIQFVFEWRLDWIKRQKQTGHLPEHSNPILFQTSHCEKNHPKKLSITYQYIKLVADSTA